MAEPHNRSISLRSGKAALVLLLCIAVLLACNTGYSQSSSKSQHPGYKVPHPVPVFSWSCQVVDEQGKPVAGVHAWLKYTDGSCQLDQYHHTDTAVSGKDGIIYLNIPRSLQHFQLAWLETDAAPYKPSVIRMADLDLTGESMLILYRQPSRITRVVTTCRQLPLEETIRINFPGVYYNAKDIYLKGGVDGVMRELSWIYNPGR